MTFELSFAGVPFAIDTPEFHEWVSKSIPLEDVRITTPERPYPGGTNLFALSLPFRHPSRPPLPFGFWYPSGALRWSEVNALATKDQVLEMVDAVLQTATGSGCAPSPLPAWQPVPATFKMVQGDTTVQTEMY